MFPWLRRVFLWDASVAIPGALEALERAGETPLPYLIRHVGGDWGDVDQHDKAENESAEQDRCRILSAYRLADDTRIWVITEADRSVTTILLPGGMLILSHLTDRNAVGIFERLPSDHRLPGRRTLTPRPTSSA
jgi:hypothetical protein